MLNLQACIDLFGSTMRGIQAYLVATGVKPGCRFSIPETALPAVADWCAQQDVHLVKSAMKVLAQPGYSDGGLAIPCADPRPGNPIIFLALDKVTAIALKAAEDLVDHQAMGKLLGYPLCCIAFFRTNFQEETDNSLRMLKPMTEASTKKRYPFQMNIFARYDDAAILFHCPCSLDCEESQRQGNQYFRSIAQAAPAIAASIKKRLIQEERQGSKTFSFIDDTA